MDKVGSMPHGFFTVEQWERTRSQDAAQWVPIKHAGPIRHFDACNTLAGVMARIEAEGRPGFLRVVQTQLMIRAERKTSPGKEARGLSGNTGAQGSGLRLRKGPAGQKGLNGQRLGDRARSEAAYQPETQLPFCVERLMPVNLYSSPTEIAKFTSNCE